MKLTAGEIPFIGERDKKSHKSTTYIKIGIVREGAKGPRTSLERLDEHQTGNPRELFLHKVIKTPAVEEVETRLHRIFAIEGVSGEWFQFKAEALELAIAKAVELRDDVKRNLKALVSSEELKKTPSNGSTRKSTAKAQRWHALFVESNVVLGEAKRLKTTFGPLLLDSTETEEEVANIVTRKGKMGSLHLDIERLRDEIPDLYNEYLGTSRYWQQRFSVKMAKESVPGLAEVDRMAFNLFLKFEEALVHKTQTEKKRSSLHSQYLEVLGIESLAVWNRQITEAQLKALCGEYEGIDGIFSWTRGNKENYEFDVTRFAAEGPEVFEKYQARRKSVEVISVIPKKGY